MGKRGKMILVGVLIGAVLLALGVGIYLVNQQQTVGSKADGSTVLYFSDAPTPAPKASEEFTVDVLLDTSTDLIAGVDALINFDPEYLQVIDIEEGSSRFDNYALLEFDNDTGDIIIGAEVGTSGSAIQGTGIVVAKITFLALAETVSTQVTYTFTPGNLNDSNVPEFIAVTSGNEPEDLLASVQPLTFSIDSLGGQAMLHLENLTPENPQCVNENFTFDILVDTNGSNISGVDSYINFDTSFIDILSIEEASAGLFKNYPNKNIDNDTGKLSVSANVGSGETAVPINGDNILVARVTAQPIANGVMDMTFDFIPNDRNDSNVTLYLADEEESVDILTSTNTMTVVINDTCGGGTGSTGSTDSGSSGTGSTGGTDGVGSSGSTGTSGSSGSTGSSSSGSSSTGSGSTGSSGTSGSSTDSDSSGTGSTGGTDGVGSSGSTGDTATGSTSSSGTSGDGDQPNLPEELPETASPAQTMGQIIIAGSFILSGLLFKQGFKREEKV